VIALDLQQKLKTFLHSSQKQIAMPVFFKLFLGVKMTP